MRRILLIPLVLGIIASCDDPVGPKTVACDPFLLEFNVAGPDTVTLASGVRYVDVSVGTGEEAIINKVIEVNYSLYTDGDVSRQRSCPPNGVLPVVLGSDGTLQAFQEGILGMRVEGVRRVLIPAELAYNTGILAGEELIFDIQLVEVY
jgi:FKBP-type peptidyl-prolyl cis-trans isomerase FkpA